MQIRLPIAEHIAWAIDHDIIIHSFGVTHVLPFLLQHLTAPLANIFDFDDISFDLGLLPCFGHPSARPSYYLFYIKKVYLKKNIDFVPLDFLACLLTLDSEIKLNVYKEDISQQ